MRTASTQSYVFAAVIACLLVVFGTLAVTTSSSAPSTSSSSSLPTSTSQSCSSSVPEDPLASQSESSALYNAHNMLNGSARWLVFTIPPGGTATFCIDIPLSQANVTISDLSSEARIVKTTSPPGSGCCAYSYSQARGINITFDPSSLNLTSFRHAAGSLNVTYTMTASATATGFYTLDYPGVCAFIPLAVTNQPQGVTQSDFPGFFVPSSCPLNSPFDGWSRMTGSAGCPRSG